MNRAIWYFAYGSNMDAEQMKSRVGNWFNRVPGLLKGWRLEFNKVPTCIPEAGFANILPFPGGTVEGVLYAVTKEALRKLDGYEGVPDHYERCQIEVERKDTGEVVDAVTYVANRDKVRDGLKPTRKYLNRLLAGADCLSEGYKRLLLDVQTLD